MLMFRDQGSTTSFLALEPAQLNTTGSQNVFEGSCQVGVSQHHRLH